MPDVNVRRPVAKIWFGGDTQEVYVPFPDESLLWVEEFHGDHDETWVLVLVEGAEVRRWNTRYLSGIEWAGLQDPPSCP